MPVSLLLHLSRHCCPRKDSCFQDRHLSTECPVQDSKQRLKAMAKNQEAISSGSFSRDGGIYAYALSYDWARGYSAYNPATAKNTIMLHSPTDIEVNKRPAASRSRR